MVKLMNSRDQWHCSSPPRTIATLCSSFSPQLWCLTSRSGVRVVKPLSLPLHLYYHSSWIALLTLLKTKQNTKYSHDCWQFTVCHLARRRHHQLGRVPALEVRVHEHRLHVDLGHVLGRGPLHPPPVRREVRHDLLQQNTACSLLLCLGDCLVIPRTRWRWAPGPRQCRTGPAGSSPEHRLSWRNIPSNIKHFIKIR